MRKQPKKSNIMHRILPLLLTGAVVLGALSLILFRDRLNLDALKRWMTYRNLETDEVGEAIPFTHAGGDKLSVAYMKKGILLASATGTHFYSYTGDQYAEEVLAMENPVLVSSDRVGLVYDAGGQSLFLFREGEEVSRLAVEGTVLSARANDSGWMAVTAQQSGYKGSVTVYNDKVEKVIQINLSSSFVVDAAISPDCKTVAVITMDQVAGEFQSNVLFYPVNKTEPSATCSLNGAMVLDMEYESNCLWILGENQLMAMKPESSELQTYSFGHAYLKGCDFGGSGYAFLLLGRYRGGSANQALVINRNGEVTASMELGSPVLSFSSAGNYCALLTSSSLSILTKDFRPYATLTTTQGARHVDLASDASALLVNAQQAWLYIPN